MKGKRVYDTQRSSNKKKGRRNSVFAISIFSKGAAFALETTSKITEERGKQTYHMYSAMMLSVVLLRLRLTRSVSRDMAAANEAIKALSLSLSYKHKKEKI